MVEKGIRDANRLYGWPMSQKLAVYGFKCKKSTFKFNEDYDEDNGKGHILEVNVEYPKELLFNKHKDLPFLPEKMKTKLNVPKKLVCISITKKTIPFT